MSMQIHSQLPVAQATAAQNAPRASSEAAPGSASRPGATATVSAQSTLIHTQSSSASDVRMDRVQSVQSALQAGTYHVDAGRVADKLMDSLMGR